VGVTVTQEPNDSGQLLPAVDRLEQRLEKKPQQMVADSGYSTRENIEKIARREIDFLGTMRYENVPRGAKLSRVRTEFRLRLPDPINKSPLGSREPAML
jgi:transposase